MEIKKLCPGDSSVIVELSRLVYNIFLRRNVQYSQINTYFDEYTDAAAIGQRMEEEKLHVWGAVENNMICGVGAMTSDGQITMLYVHPDYQRRTIGEQLLETMKRFAATELDLPHIIVNASPAFTGTYFMRHGFWKMDMRQNAASPYMSLTADSVYIRTYPRKSLPAPAIAGIVCGFTLLAFLSVFGYSTVFAILH